MSSPQQTMDCPTDETLAAFIDGRLEGEARERIVEHVAMCDSCHAVWQSAAEFHAAEAPPNVVKGRFGWEWGVAAIAASLAAIVCTPLLLDRFGDRDGFEGLVAAADQLHRRPILGRLSGGFSYKPVRESYRGDNATSVDAAQYALDAAVGKVSLDARDDPSASKLHALAIAHILAGERDEAIDLLERLVKTSSGQSELRLAIRSCSDARLLSDLSAAYYARARFGGHPASYRLASETADRAWKLDNTSREIAWNRALAVEGLQLRDQAIAAWRDYLRLDPTGPWAKEAQDKIAKLSERTDLERWQTVEPLVRVAALAGDQPQVARLLPGFSQPARVLVEESLLPCWAHNGADAEDCLRVAQTISNALAETTEDPFLADSIRVIRSSNATERARLASGHAQIAEAQTAYRTANASRALELLNSVPRDMGSSPYVARTFAIRAGAAFNRLEYQEALSALDEGEYTVPPKYSAVRAQLKWIRGLVLLSTGYPVEALQAYREARQEFERLGERESVASLDDLLAQGLGYMGDDAESEIARHRALTALGELGRVQRAYVIYSSVARAAQQQGDLASAGRFIDRMVDIAAASPDPSFVAGSLNWRASWRAKAGDVAHALRDIEQSRALLTQIRDERVRSRSRTNVDATAAGILTAGRPAEALPLLDRAVLEHEKNRSSYALAQAYADRGKVKLRLNDIAGAARDFDAAVGSYENTRVRIADHETRSTYFAHVREAGDALVNLLASEGRALDALWAAERIKSRVLLDTMDPASRDDRLPRIPPGYAVVELHDLDDRVLLWTLTTETTLMKEVTLTRIEGASLRERLIAELQRGESRGPANQYLSTLLASSFTVKDVASYTVIPSENLRGLPFGALWAGNERLIARRDFAIAPSLRILRVLSDRRSSPAEGAAMFGNSLPLPGTGQDHLAEAVPEVKTLARIYPGSAVYAGGATTKEQFLAALRSRAIVHYAGHALDNPERPLFSAIAVVQGQAAVPLYAHEILAAGSIRSPLVVLNACGTGRPGRNSQGMSTLAETFIAAGADQVLATAWEVDDADSAEFFKRFYPKLLAGSSPARALCAVQRELAMNHEQHENHSWMAWQIYGGMRGESIWIPSSRSS